MFWGEPTSQGLYNGSNNEDKDNINAKDKIATFIGSSVAYVTPFSVERGMNHGYNPTKSAGYNPSTGQIQDYSAWPTPAKRRPRPDDSNYDPSATYKSDDYCWNQDFDVMNAKDWAQSDNLNHYSWGNAKHSYSLGTVGQKLAYYQLGHIAHLLSDVSVPSHVHIIDHGSFFAGWGLSDGGCINTHDDNYEKFLYDIDRRTGTSKVLKYLPLANAGNIPVLTDLNGAFYDLATKTHGVGNGERYVDDADGNGWGSYVNPDICYRLDCLEPDIDSAKEQERLNRYANELVPKAAEYVAGLFRLFWDETHAATDGTIGGAVDNTALTWTTGGNANWAGQTTTSYYGGSSAQSGGITDSQSTWMQTTVTGSGTLSFYWKVSSESGYDFLRFYIDGVEQSGSISGTVDWTQKTYTIPSGSHTLKWEYAKDGSLSSGSDAGWVDRVVYSGQDTCSRCSVNKKYARATWTKNNDSCTESLSTNVYADLVYTTDCACTVGSDTSWGDVSSCSGVLQTCTRCSINKKYAEATFQTTGTVSGGTCASTVGPIPGTQVTFTKNCSCTAGTDTSWGDVSSCSAAVTQTCTRCSINKKYAKATFQTTGAVAGGTCASTVGPIPGTQVTYAKDCSCTAGSDTSWGDVSSCSAVTYTVTPSAGTGGTISPSSPQTVAQGATTIFTVTPSTGYSISSVSGCGGNLNGSTYTTGAIAANCLVTATFTSNTDSLTGTWVGTWTWSGPGSNGCQFSDGGSFSMTLTQTGTSFSGITSGAGIQGRDNTTCALSTYVDAAGTASGTISGTALNLSFDFSTLNTTMSFTGTATLNNNTLTASFVRSTGGSGSFTLTKQGVTHNAYTVTPSAGTGGSISPSSPQTVAQGATTVFTVTPNTGYNISSVSGCGCTLSGNNTYTTGAITANCTVVASFTNTLPCTVSFNTSSSSIDASGGQRQVILTTSNSSCTWSATSDQAWVHNITPSSGTAGATLTYTVDPNTSTQSRSATIVAGQATLTVSQLGTSISCTFSLGYTTQSVPANGGTYLEGLLASNQSCARTAQSNVAFITNVSPASGNGDANISYTVAQNTSTSPRSGTLTIAGQTLTVNQDGAVPVVTGTLSLSPTSCVIASGASTCSTVHATWSTTNATNPQLVDGNVGAVLSNSANQSGFQVWVAYPQTVFYLKDGSTQLATRTATASCAAGSTWNGTSCAAPVDTTPPTISTFSVTPSSLTVGSPFTISYTVSDTGGSGLWQMQLWRTTDSNGVPNANNWNKIKSDSLSGNGPVSGSFTDAPPSAGTYWYGGHGVDTAINIGYEPSRAKVIVNATATLIPYISYVSPNPAVATGAAQPFTINGGNFASGATVTLRTSGGGVYANRAISSLSATQIVINPNFGTIAGTWTVEVINPGTVSSGKFTFTVRL